MAEQALRVIGDICGLIIAMGIGGMIRDAQWQRLTGHTYRELRHKAEEE